MKERKPCYNCGSQNTIRYVTSLMADMPEIKEEMEEGVTKVKPAGVGNGASSHYICQDCGYRWEMFQEQQLDREMSEREAAGKDKYLGYDFSKKKRERKKWFTKKK